MRLLLLATAAGIAAAEYVPDYTCAILDKYKCINQTECGWCEAHYTCMRGNESHGPLPGSRPCPDDSLFIPFEKDMSGQDVARKFAWRAEDLDKMFHATDEMAGKHLKARAGPSEC